MTRRLVYSSQARADLEEIFFFIAADNPARAGSYVAEIETACENLCDTPMIGIARPDIQLDLRILALWRRVVVAYRISPETVEVLRVSRDAAIQKCSSDAAAFAGHFACPNALAILNPLATRITMTGKLAGLNIAT